MNFNNFYKVFTIPVKTGKKERKKENCLWCYTDNQLHLWALKSVRKNTIWFKLFWYKVFVQKLLKLIL